MKHPARNKLVAAIALLFVPALVKADVKISFKLQGGWTYVSAGEVNRANKALFNWEGALWPTSQGGYRPVRHGVECGGDFIFEFTPRIGVGIGCGYLTASRGSLMEFADPENDIDGGLSARPELSALPVRLSLILRFPLSAKIDLTTRMGGSYYFLARYNDEIRENSFSGLGQIHGFYGFAHRAEIGSAALGLDAGIGIEYRLNSRVFLCLDATGRFAKLHGWEGSSTIYNEFLNMTEHGTLYYESFPALPDFPRLIMVQTDPPAGPGGKPRQAVIDFSGISLQAGIRICL